MVLQLKMLKMKKSTNKFRRCANCPHHSSMRQSRCCCKPSTTYRPRAATSRVKGEPSTIEHSSTLNTTIPTIMAEFSALRTENNQLKRELLNVSTFLKDENHPPNNANDNILSEKLFIANRTLKEALLEIDGLSRANKELCQRNNRLSEQCQGFKIQLKEVEVYLEKYKKRCRKIERQNGQWASREEVEGVCGINVQLEEENRQLKEQIRCLRYQNQNFNLIGTLSPQWVAHTGHKVRGDPIGGKNEEESTRQEIEVWRRSLSQTIGVLRNQATQLSNSSVQGITGLGLQSLVSQLLQSYSESILSHFQLLMKQLTRKLNNYQKKMGNLSAKLQNLMMVFGNKRLKKKLPAAGVMGVMGLMKTERVAGGEGMGRVL